MNVEGEAVGSSSGSHPSGFALAIAFASLKNAQVLHDLKLLSVP